MIILLVNYKVAKGKNIELLKALYESGFVETTRNEDGNISYEYFLPEKDDGTTLFLVEKWRDKEAFEAHIGAENMKIAQNLKVEFDATTELKKFEATEI